MDPLWSETCCSTSKYFIILIVSMCCLICISWTIKYLKYSILTPWSRVLLQKLTGLQLVKKFPALYGTPRFITASTSVRHLSLSWATSIQSMLPHPTSCRPIFNILLPSTSRSSEWSLSPWSPYQNLACTPPSPIRSIPHATHPHSVSLTLTLLTWKIWWANNESKWQMGFNLAFKRVIWSPE
jgi:hypothetical protein